MATTESVIRPESGTDTVCEPESGRQGRPFSRILVPIDGSAQAERVLPVALLIARAAGANVELVWVRTPRGRRGDDGTMVAASVRQSYLETLTEDVGDRLGAPACRTILTGRPADEILRHAREQSADLVVMASRGYGGLWRLGIGSTTDALVRSMPVPMIIQRAPEEETGLDRPAAIEDVLIALDGSDSAEAAISPAVELSLLLHASVTLLRVVETPVLPVSTYLPHAIELTREQVKRETDAARAYLERIAARLRTGGLAVQTAVREAPSAGAGIMRYAREVGSDLIAVATHGRGRASRLLIGSTASRLLHDSDLPVLVTNTAVPPWNRG